jgi:hypothetical protein
MGGATIDNANKCNHLVSANVLFLNPNLNVVANITVVHNDDEVTVITSNRSHQRINKTAVQARPSIAATARTIFGKPMPQYLTHFPLLQKKPLLTLVQQQYSSWTPRKSTTNVLQPNCSK